MGEDLKLYKHHKNYSIYRSEQEWLNYYSDGMIESLQMIHGEFDCNTNVFSPSKITIKYKAGLPAWKNASMKLLNRRSFRENG